MLIFLEEIRDIRRTCHVLAKRQNIIRIIGLSAILMRHSKDTSQKVWELLVGDNKDLLVCM